LFISARTASMGGSPPSRHAIVHGSGFFDTTLLFLVSLELVLL